MQRWLCVCLFLTACQVNNPGPADSGPSDDLGDSSDLAGGGDDLAAGNDLLGQCAPIADHCPSGQLGTPPACLSPEVAASIRLLEPQLTQMAVDTQTALATKSSASDPQYYDQGVWYANFPMPCPNCTAGPAAEAATLWLYSGKSDALLLQRAIDTMDKSIATYQNTTVGDPDYGAIKDPSTAATWAFPDLLARIYLELAGSLDAATKDRWQKSLELWADWLVRKGNNTYYINGNFMIGQAAALYKIWLVTGQQKYKDLYEAQLQFAVAPTQPRWAGYGLVITKQPSCADGSDGAGYLTESGGSGPGYDGDYTHFALTLAADLYEVSRDPRVLRLANLFLNQLLPHVDGSYVLDATGGSRHSLKLPFYTSGPIILAWIGGRSDLLPRLQDQFTKAIKPQFLGNAQQNWGSLGLYRETGLDLATLVIAAHHQY